MSKLLSQHYVFEEPLYKSETSAWLDRWYQKWIRKVPVTFVSRLVDPFECVFASQYATQKNCSHIPLSIYRQGNVDFSSSTVLTLSFAYCTEETMDFYILLISNQTCIRRQKFGLGCYPKERNDVRLDHVCDPSGLNTIQVFVQLDVNQCSEGLLTVLPGTMMEIRNL